MNDNRRAERNSKRRLVNVLLAVLLVLLLGDDTVGHVILRFQSGGGFIGVCHHGTITDQGWVAIRACGGPIRVDNSSMAERTCRLSPQETQRLSALALVSAITGIGQQTRSTSGIYAFGVLDGVGTEPLKAEDEDFLRYLMLNPCSR